MAAPRVSVKVELDAKSAEAGFKALASSAKRSFTEINQGLDIALKIFNTFEGLIRSSIGAAIESEAAQAMLNSALKVNGDLHEATFRSLQKFNAEMERKLGIDDDEIAKLQTKLAALGVQNDQLERATKATLGLADATGKDLTRAANEVAEAFKRGDIEAQRLTALFSASEAQAESTAGSIRKITTAVASLGEAVGNLFLRADKATGFSAFLADQAQLISDFYIKALSPPPERVLVRTSNDPQADARLFGPPRDLKGPPKKGQRKTSSLDDLSEGALRIFESGEFANEIDLELAEKSIDRERALLDERDKNRIQSLDREFEAREFYGKLRTKHYKEEDELFEARMNATSSFWNSSVAITGQGLAGILGSLGAGQDALGDAARRAFAGVLAATGQALFALGTAAIVAGTLGTVAPIFAGPTGGPIGVGAGIALAAAGLGLMAGGGFVGNSGAGKAPSIATSTPSRTVGDFGRSSEITGFSGTTQRGGTTTINVNLGAGFVTGTPRQVGRTIREMLREADSLAFGRDTLAYRGA